MLICRQWASATDMSEILSKLQPVVEVDSSKGRLLRFSGRPKPSHKFLQWGSWYTELNNDVLYESEHFFGRIPLVSPFRSAPTAREPHFRMVCSPRRSCLREPMINASPRNSPLLESATFWWTGITRFSVGNIKLSICGLRYPVFLRSWAIIHHNSISAVAGI